MAITKTYFMLMAQDMDRAVRFYQSAFGLELRSTSPDWSELSFGDATVALHYGGTGEVRDTGLGFETDDATGACSAVVAGGGTVVAEPAERGGEGIVLATVQDTEGNRLSISQTVA
jgi:predicted enzyme related to lactoylglutathione lyase